MDNTGKSFELAKVNIANDSIGPLVAADVLLTDHERRQGCVLVDLGADTTTISIYKGGYLRFLTVVPMGGQNITRDLCSLQLDEQEAERIKGNFGILFPTSADETVQLDASRVIEVRKIHDVIEARFEEIMLNVCHQIEASGYDVKNLLAGIVFCGGGINLKGIEGVLAQKFPSIKVRLAHDTVTQVDWDTATHPENGTQGVLVGLLMAGDECCFQETQMEIQPEDYKVAVTGNLFTDEGESAQEERDRKREEERQRKRDEADKRAQERKEKQKGFLSGIMKKIKSVGEKFEEGIGEFLADEDNNENNK
jgi:cell division protein FtsA